MRESVWDYPRPPRIEPDERLVRVVLGGEVVAESRRTLRVLETSHPPNFYVPLADVAPAALEASGGKQTFCEWKGHATYYNVVVAGRRAERAAWTYLDPTEPFVRLRDHVAFYVEPMDECTVDGEVVTPEHGAFYGGWVTREIEL